MLRGNWPLLTKRTPPQPPENYALLPIGHGLFALVDYDVYEWAVRYRWRVVKSSHCSYIIRRHTVAGQRRDIRLHVEINKPPPGHEVHHIDRNRFNNLRSNLQNVTPSEHRQLHGKAL